MDDLHYQHPLNVAHQYARTAESHEKSLRFEEASKCHLQAVELIKQCSRIATFASTLESLELQQQYHLRQEQILALKKAQFELHKKLLAHKKRQMAQAQIDLNLTENKEHNLQWAIFRNIETADSLIETLIDRDVKSKVEDSSSELSKSPAYNTGIKHPKNESTVIEELHTLNHKLRELISQLLSQLDESHKEIVSLKEQLKYYKNISSQKSVKNDSEQNLIDFNSISSSTESLCSLPSPY